MTSQLVDRRSAGAPFAFARKQGVAFLALGVSIVLAGCATGGSLKLSVIPSHPQDIAGHWVVDASRSEDPDAKAQLLASERGGRAGGSGGHAGGHGGGMGGGGMGGMGGGHGGHGGGRGSTPGDSSTPSHGDSGLVGQLQHRGLIPDKLDITQRPGIVVLAPDGRPVSVSVDRASVVSTVGTQAGWDGDTFVVVMHAQGHPDVTQRYSVSADRKWLTVTTAMKMGKSTDFSRIREFAAAP